MRLADGAPAATIGLALTTDQGQGQGQRGQQGQRRYQELPTYSSEAGRIAGAGGTSELGLGLGLDVAGDVLPTYQSEYTSRRRQEEHGDEDEDEDEDEESPSWSPNSSDPFNSSNSDNPNDNANTNASANVNVNEGLGIWARANRHFIPLDLERRLRVAGYSPEYDPERMGKDVWKDEYAVSPIEVEVLRRLYARR